MRIKVLNPTPGTRKRKKATTANSTNTKKEVNIMAKARILTKINLVISLF